MSKQKKNFPCGHRGFGEYCHFCRQIDELMKSGIAKEQAVQEIKRLSAASTAPAGPAGNVSKIIKIEIHPAREVFGENAYNPDRPTAVIWTENGARLVAMIPLGAKYIDGNLKIFDPAKYQRSIMYTEDGKPKSKFGAFVARYGSWPRIGLTVATLTDERGCLTIDVKEVNGDGKSVQTETRP